MAHHPRELLRKLAGLTDVPRDRFPDPVAYWRARLVRGVLLVGVSMNVLQLLSMAPTPQEPGRVLALLGSMCLGSLAFLLSGRGPRTLTLLGCLVVPVQLVMAWGCYYKGFGIADPGAFAIVCVVGLSALLLGEWGILVSTAIAVPTLIWLGWTTAAGRLPSGKVLPPDLPVGILTGTNVATVLFVAVLLSVLGRIMRRVIALRDIADARAAELAELDAVKTVFLQNISHEFRQPITLVLSPIEERLRRADRDPPDLQRLLTMARRNLRRLLRMVGALLDFAAVQAGGLAISREPQDLPALTRALAGELAGPVEAAGLTLQIDCPPMDQPVWVDRRMWETIVMNLLSNALKFTMRGAISLSLRRVGDEVELRVRDTGCGIAKEDQPKLFQRFRRLEPKEARSHEGSGIGLALVADLVRMHQGRIAVESDVGQGATFVVRMPLRPAAGEDRGPADRRPRAEAVTPAAYADEAMSWVTTSSGSAPPPPAEAAPAAGAGAPGEAPAHPDRRPLVLVADDNGDMRRFLADQLGERWRVRAVPDGQAVLDAVEEELPDLILSDVMMPRLDGISLVRELRRRSRTAGLPIILLSARADHRDTVEGLEAQADDYIAKPFSVPELLARVQVHLELHLARRDAARRQHRFVKVLIHELRSPLTVAKGATDMLVDRVARKDNDNADLLLRHASRGIRRMEGLLTQLSDAARIEAGGLVLRPGPFDLTELCTEVAGEQEVAAGRRVVAEVPPEPVVVEGDRERIGQVLGNLIGNSFKYDLSGEPVRLSLRVEGEEAVVTVRDHGIGVPEADLERVFEANYRTEEAQKVARGVGLGLFLCRHIIDLHGGRISARREDVGTSFVFTLPLHGCAPDGRVTVGP